MKKFYYIFAFFFFASSANANNVNRKEASPSAENDVLKQIKRVKEANCDDNRVLSPDKSECILKIPRCNRRQYLDQSTLTCQPLPPTSSECRAKGLVLDEKGRDCRRKSFSDICSETGQTYEFYKTLSQILNSLEAHNCSEALEMISKTGKLDLSASVMTISDLRPIGYLTELRELDLSQNQIIDISPLVNLKKLRILRLQHNLIGDVEMLGQLPNLEEVDLSGNPVYDLGAISTRPGIKLKM